jgi:hypothetical protein
MIETAPLAKAVHIADEARSISIMTTIEFVCPSASYKAGEKHVSSFLFVISNFMIWSVVICENLRDQREIKNSFPADCADRR